MDEKITKEDGIERYSLFSDVAHGIRTPMNVIYGNCELIQQENISLKAREYVMEVRAAAEQLLSVIDDSLDVLKIEDGSLELRTEEYFFRSVINDAISSIRSQAEEKKLEVKLECADGLPYKLYGDRMRVCQILRKLLGNAVRYTKSGYVGLRISCEYGENLDVCLKFDVTDTGIGILDDDLERILGKSSKYPGTRRKRSIEGAGIGLNLARGLAKLLGGDITVESKYSVGSTFTATVYQQSVGVSTLDDYPEEQDMSGLDLRIPFRAVGAKALIVDDNLINARVAYYLIKRYGIDADIADCGERAIALVQRIRYDLIFMDHMMPGLDGTDITKVIREMIGFSMDDIDHMRKIPIIALTANIEPGAAEMYIKEGMNDYLAKPIEIKELERILRTWLPETMIQYISCFDIRNSGMVQAFVSLGIDYATAVNNLNGNEEEYYSVLKCFYNNGSANIAQIKKDLEEHNYKSYIVTIRGLIGEAQVIGAEHLLTMLRELEEAYSKDVMSPIEQGTKLMLQYYERMLKSIAILLQSPDEGEIKSGIAKEELIMTLEELISEIRSYQIDQALHRFYRLAQSTFEDEEIMLLLHEAEEEFEGNYNYKASADKLGEILTKLKGN